MLERVDLIGVLGQLASMAYPALAWMGLAAMSIPLLVHMLARLRRRKRAWGAMRLVIEANRRHRFRMRIEQWLLLATRCALVGAAGLAFSGPSVESTVLKGTGPVGGGRSVALLVDNSLSSQIQVRQGVSRFDELRRAARQVLDGLGPADEVGLWHGARPASRLAALTTDHDLVRRQLEAMLPTASRSDLAGAVQRVLADMAAFDACKLAVVVVVLSDLDHDTLDTDRQLPEALLETARQAQWWLPRPMKSVANLQIMALRPMRELVLVDDPSVPLAVEIQLRRFTTDAAEATYTIELTHGAAEPLSRKVHFARGERISAPLTVTIPVAAGPEVLPHGSLAIGARILDAHDPLAADDIRRASVQLRRQIQVALLDQQTGSAADGPGPGDWLGAALVPDPDPARRLIELVHMAAGQIDRQRLATMDAIFVLRPDLVGRDGFAYLGHLVAEGQMVVITAPAIQDPAPWSDLLIAAVDQPWELDDRPVDRAGSWMLATDDPVPDLLGRLTGDWEALLQPVRVMRRLGLAAGGDAELWLRLAEGRQPLVAATQIGDGTLVLIATAIDPEWTNLPIKPLFPALVQEMTRSILGRAASRMGQVVAGDRPLLSRQWQGARQLVLQDGSLTAAVPLVPDPGAGALAPSVPLVEPGFYRSEAGGAPLLAVNADAAGGWTIALDQEALASWCAALGAWQWLDLDRAGAPLTAEAQHIGLGVPLLWLTLCLLLVETALARWFSHAAA